MNKAFLLMKVHLTEKNVYYGLLGWMVLVYFLAGFTNSTSEIYFGFSQLRNLRAGGMFLVLILLVLVFTQSNRPALARAFEKLNTWFFSNPLPTFLTAICAVIVFYLFRTNFINGDGLALEGRFLDVVPLDGAFFSYDEALEFYIHSRFWALTHQAYGWSVNQAYSCLSVLAGGVFIFILLKYCRQLLPEKALLLAGLCISSGYMQLFFGDVENYTLTATVLTGYLLASALYLNKSLSLVYPASILALALTFHLLSSFFLPSLAYLYYVAVKRRQFQAVFKSLAVFLVVLGLIWSFMVFNGLSINNFWNSHVYAASRMSYYWTMAGTPGTNFGDYYFGLFNLLFLLVPGWVLLIPLAIYRKIEMTEQNIFLSIILLVGFFFFIFWRAQLGPYGDWNLFAVFGIPLSILIWSNLLRSYSKSRLLVVLVALGMLFFAHSYSWVLYNHNL